jgi:hypothetical protein
VKRTRNYRIREQDSTLNLETESQPQRLGGTKDTYLWTGVPLHTFDSIKQKGGEKVMAGETGLC